MILVVFLGSSHLTCETQFCLKRLNLLPQKMGFALFALFFCWGRKDAFYQFVIECARNPGSGTPAPGKIQKPTGLPTDISSTHSLQREGQTLADSPWNVIVDLFRTLRKPLWGFSLHLQLVSCSSYGWEGAKLCSSPLLLFAIQGCVDIVESPYSLPHFVGEHIVTWG